MRVLASLAVVVLVASACPTLLAPPATSGESAGGVCVSDVDCASGLACECGVCATPTGQPPRCLALDDECGEVPSDCFRACGDPTVVGQAECVGGRESCAAAGGVLRRQCPSDTCWEPAAPGEICVDGERVCRFQPPAPNGQCFTFDCEGEPGRCVSACGDGSAPFSQVCIANEWQCETGVPVESCGACVGPVPTCVASCAGLEPAGIAACTAALEWSCAHFVIDGTPAEVVTDCCDENPDACPVDAGPDDGGAPDASDVDAGDEDAGDDDAGEVDGGAPVDASLPTDGGGVDGGDGVGPVDAGDPGDAAEGDAG